MRALRLALTASELTPFAKTGGLADVLLGLGRWLGQPASADDGELGAGHDVRLFVPFYRRIQESGVEVEDLPEAQAIDVKFPERTIRFGIKAGKLPQSEVAVYFVDCPELYDRDGIYTEDKDEPLRFAMLSRAVLETCQRLQWAPDVIHCNDWHTALLPLYLRTTYTWDQLFAKTRTLLTIHNIGYQGYYDASQLDSLGLGAQRAHVHHGDLKDGKFSFLKSGVLHANRLSTVSRTYAEEIQTDEFGMGMQELLRGRSADLVGIVNGVDYGEWNPKTDPKIPHNYSLEDMSGKAKMKAALLDRFQLPHDARAPPILLEELDPERIARGRAGDEEREGDALARHGVRWRLGRGILAAESGSRRSPSGFQPNLGSPGKMVTSGRTRRLCMPLLVIQTATAMLMPMIE